MPGYLKYAGIAQLVERNLAKVEVASSSLVSRSKYPKEVPTSFKQKGKPSLPFFGFGVFQVFRPSCPLGLKSGFCRCIILRSDAGIAQLVERNLAKVEVASSNLVSRSRH